MNPDNPVNPIAVRRELQDRKALAIRLILKWVDEPRASDPKLLADRAWKAACVIGERLNACLEQAEWELLSASSTATRVRPASVTDTVPLAHNE